MYLQNLSELDMQKLKEARDMIINAMAETMDLYGISPSTGRLYATLFFVEEPMTLDEMAKALGMSKTSMSNTARALLDKKMVEKVWQKGVRKDLYVAEKDFFKTFNEFFCYGWRREIEFNMKAIYKSVPILEELLNSDDVAAREVARRDLDKLEKAKEYYLWLSRLVECVESERIFELIPQQEKSK